MTHEPGPAIGVARDLVLLLARIGLGIIMLGHAKLMYDFGGGLGGVGQLFAQMGAPLPAVAGPANVLFEFVGGVMMIVGLAVPIVGVVMALNMVGAWILAHPGALYALDHTGPELVIVVGLLSLVLAVTGSGRFGLDHVIVGRARHKVRSSAG
jgi:putative oxidoreductase